MPFISNTDKERKEMLADIGVSDFKELIKNIPQHFLLEKNCCIDDPASELEITRRISLIANQNKNTDQANSFLGGGIYDHYIPAAVDHILLRPEFHTAYTPYQAEVSQGTLQYIYEFQTMICQLTGMEIANAGMYDGASATAEAVLMAVRHTRKYNVLISDAINPLYKDVIKTYTEGIGVNIQYFPTVNGVTNLDKLKEMIDDETAGVVMQTPNFFGNLEDMFAADAITHEAKKALFIAVVDPISLPLLNCPNEYHADIVVGEGQALGNPQNFGGPLFGFFASNLKLARKMPGRIVGATKDSRGNKAYALTLQAREQHIRRDKATSNICSNDALCTLAATVYMSLMGKEGIKEVAEQSMTKAHYLAQEISKLDGYEMAFDSTFFKEFVIKTPIKAAELYDKLDKKDILAGIALSRFGYDDNLLMIAVTEKKRKSDLDAFVSALREVNNG